MFYSSNQFYPQTVIHADSYANANVCYYCTFTYLIVNIDPNTVCECMLFIGQTSVCRFGNRYLAVWFSVPQWKMHHSWHWIIRLASHRGVKSFAISQNMNHNFPKMYKCIDSALFDSTRRSRAVFIYQLKQTKKSAIKRINFFYSIINSFWFKTRLNYAWTSLMNVNISNIKRDPLIFGNFHFCL